MTDNDASRGLSMERARVRGLLISAAIFSVFANLLVLTGPVFMLQVYDRVLGSRSEETLVALFALVAVLYLFYWLLDFSRGRVMGRVAARFQGALSTPVFHAVLRRAALRAGSETGTLRDLEAIRTCLSSPVMLALFDLPWTPIFTLAIFLFHPLLGWLAVAGGALLVVIAVLNQFLTRKKSREAARHSEVATRFATQAEQAGELLWAQGMRRAMAERWSTFQDSSTRLSVGAADWMGSFTSLSKAFRLFLQSAMLATGAWLVLQNEITAGAMVAASILLGRALAPVEVAVSQWWLVQRARSGWRDLRCLLAQADDPPIRTELPAPRARLELKDVSVVLRRGDKPVLQRLSLELSPGQAVGVIGRSGSGKTTLARVIVGLIRPSAGEVRVDGATVGQYGPDRLGQYIGYLPQEIDLFEGSVAENIAQMEMRPDGAKVVAAAQKARVHDVILSLPDGYDTRINGAQAQLSGGQKQRLALARALYNDPVLLVLDEPNSALDAEGSEALGEVVRAMKAQEKAVLIMTHRPTAIAFCDTLLVLDAGKVAAHGPRDEIIRKMMKNASDIQKVTGREAAR